MLDFNMLIKYISHYCDSLWEFNRSDGRMYVHYDRIAPGLMGKWCTIDEMVRSFTEDCGIVADRSIWNTYLNVGYLQHFFDNGVTDDTFEMRFTLKGGDALYWYSMHIEKTDDDTLVLSAKDMNNVFRYRSIYDSAKNAFDFILSIDSLTGRYTVIHTAVTESPSIKEMLYSEMIKEYIMTNAADDSRDELVESLALDNVKRQLKSKKEYIVFGEIRTNGKLRFKKLTFTYLDPNERFITMHCLDVSGMAARYEQLLEKIRDDSHRDKLTGAYNRNYYETNLRNRRFSGGVAIIDIDDLKLCNDTYGHKAGDEVIVNVSQVISTCMRSHDVLIRFGGDEFLLLMPGSGAAQLDHMLETIRRSVCLVSVKGFENIGITLSSGGIVCENDIISDAVFDADRMMYRAKATKNSFVTEKTIAQSDGNDDAPGTEDRQKVLIVDDSPFNRDLLSEVLKDDFDILEAENGRQCMDILDTSSAGDISLVLLDIIMPVMNGFEVLSAMRDRGYSDDIPVIVITVDSTDADIRRAFDCGVADYISRPYDAAVIKRRVQNTVRLYSKQRRLASIVARSVHDKEHNSRMTIDMLSNIIGFKSGESGYHAKHIRKITAMLLETLVERSGKYSLSWKKCDIICRASVFHDVGKLGIDAEILNKPGKLTSEEFEEIKKHTVIGEEIMRSEMLGRYRNEPLIEIAAQICRWHHERYDGSGYPDGLSGDNIPIAAQVVSVADVYDALVSDRVYKKAIPPERAAEMILNGECGVFNPLLMDCLKAIWPDIRDEVYNDINGGDDEE